MLSPRHDSVSVQDVSLQDVAFFFPSSSPLTSCLLMMTLTSCFHLTMIIASSCLFTQLASLAQTSHIDAQPIARNIAPIASRAVHQVIAKVAKTKTAFNLVPDKSALKNFRVAANGENPLDPLATSTFFTSSCREDFSGDSSKPTLATFGYLTETCFAAYTNATFAYRCNESNFTNGSPTTPIDDASVINGDPKPNSKATVTCAAFSGLSFSSCHSEL
jgi:hypothetical protein